MDFKRIIGKINTYFVSKDSYHEIFDLMKGFKNEPIVNDIPEKCKSIAFVVGGINRYGGGTTSILRLGSILSEMGMDVDYILYTQDAMTAKANAGFALDGWKGEFVDYATAMKKTYDFVTATWWASTYKAVPLKGYKLYFVQDYEPLFYGMSEHHLLAKKTYEMGFHIISLGQWNLNMIRNGGINDSTLMNYVSFPYEPSEYVSAPHDFSHMKTDRTVKMAVYIKSVGKRVPYLVQWLLGEVKREIESMDYEGKRYRVILKYFGIDPRFPVQNGSNLGRLSKEELHDLYAGSDFGVVASMTNISLVPYEMIASGLPVIDFKDGSYSCFMSADSAILTDLDPHKLSMQMMRYIQHPELLDELIQRGQKQIENLSWQRTAEEFYRLLRRISRLE